MEGYEGDEPVAEAPVTTRPSSTKSPPKLIDLATGLPPRTRGTPNPQQLMSDHQAVQPRQAKPYSQMNRPMRHISHHGTGTQSPSISSVSSGVSKKRTRSTTSDLNFVRQRVFPQVANNINDFFRMSDNAVKEAEEQSKTTLNKCRKKLEKKSQQLAEYLETINIMQQAMEASQDEERSLRAHIEDLERQLQVSSDNFSVLTDKSHTMKEKLNSALKQNQELFELHKGYKNKSEETIQEIRGEKQREQSMRELIDRQLTGFRDKMKERVRQVEQQSQEECHSSEW